MLNRISANPVNDRDTASYWFAMGKDSANQDLSTPSPEKKAKLSERLQAYAARKHQERKLKEAQVSRIKEAQTNARIAQGPRQRAVHAPPPIWGPRFPLDASSESLNTNEGPPLPAPLGHPSGIVLSLIHI